VDSCSGSCRGLEITGECSTDQHCETDGGATGKYENDEEQPEIVRGQEHLLGRDHHRHGSHEESGDAGDQHAAADRV